MPSSQGQIKKFQFDYVLGAAVKLRQMSVLAFNILEGEQGNVSLSLSAVRNSVYQVYNCGLGIGLVVGLVGNDCSLKDQSMSIPLHCKIMIINPIKCISKTLILL